MGSPAAYARAVASRAGIDEWHIIRVGNDYAAEHPVWHFGLAELAEWHLSPELRARLEAWAEYWQQHMHWEHGWTSGAQDPWFERERRALPRDLSSELGPAFLIVGELESVRSDEPPTNPQAAAAVEAIAASERALSGH